MPVRTAIKRVWLRRQFALVPATYPTLLAAIEAEAFGVIDLVKRGSIAATSAGDRSTTFSNAAASETQGDFAALAGEMLDLYEAAVAALASGEAVIFGFDEETIIGLGGDEILGAGSDDAQIFVEMLARLQPIYEFRTNYTGLRG